MKVILTDEEVREALVRAVEEKTQHVLGSADEEDCYFNIMTSNGEAQDVETVEFVCNSF